MLNLKPEILTQQLSLTHSDTTVTSLHQALAACDRGILDPYLATLSLPQAANLQAIATDLSEHINDNITAYDEDFVNAITWIAAAADAAAEGRIY